MATPRALVLLTMLVLAPYAALPLAGGAHLDPAPVLAPHGSLPEGRSGAAVAWSGSEAFLFGGWADVDGMHVARADALAFDPATGATRTIPFPEWMSARAGAVAAELDGTIYLFGGYVEDCVECLTTFNGVVAFDPATGSFEQIVPDGAPVNPFGDPIVGMGAASLNGLVHLFGGCHPWNGCTDAVRTFDPLAPATWEDSALQARLPYPMDAMAVAADGLGSIYLAGGYGRTEAPTFVMDAVLLFDGTAFYDMPALPYAVANAGAFVVDDRLYLLGGEDQAGPFGSIVRYDLAQYAAPAILESALPVPLAGSGVVWTGELAYALGGRSDAGIESGIHQFSPAPRLLEARVDGETLTLSYDRALLETDVWPWLEGDVNGIPFYDVSGTTSGTTATLRIPGGVASGDTLRITYRSGWSLIADLEGNGARHVTDLEVVVDTPLHQLPSAMDAPAAVMDGAHVLFLGGHRGLDAPGAIVRYAPLTGEVRTERPLARGEGTSATWAGDRVHIIGGEPSTGELVALATEGGSGSGAILAYDPATGALETTAYLPAALASLRHAATVAHGSDIYVIGGETFDPGTYSWTPRGTILRYDTTTPSAPPVLFVEELPVARVGASATFVPTCGCILVAGGRSYSGALSSIDRIELPGVTVTTLEEPLSLVAPAERPLAFWDGAALLVLADDEAQRIFLDRPENVTLPLGPAPALSRGAIAWSGSVAYGAGERTGILRYEPDLAPPSLSASLTTVANTLGWHTSPTQLLLASEAGATLSFDAGSGRVPGAVVDLPEGITTLTAYARDRSGNEATLGPIEVRVDTVAPQGWVSGHADGAQGTVVFSFTEPMRRTAVEGALSGAEGWTRTWSDGDSRLTLSIAELPVGTTTLAVGTGATDHHGVPIGTPLSTSVTREAPPTSPSTPTSPPAHSSARPPDAPIALAAVVSGVDARVGWSPPALDNGAPVTGYSVVVDGAAPVVLGGTYLDLPGLARGSTHTVTVRALNSAGEGAPASLSFSIPPVSTLSAPTPSSSGWHASLPLVSFVVEPADATIVYDHGDGPTTYAGPFAIPSGERTLRWSATAGAASEAPRERAFRVDAEPPQIGGATVTGGASLSLRVSVTDAHSGVASVDAILTPAGGGAPVAVPLARSAGTTYEGDAAVTPGAYAVTFAARDAAGHTAEAPSGSASVLAPPAGGSTPGASDPGVPLEPSSLPGPSGGSTPDAGGGDAGAPGAGEPPAQPPVTPPRIVISQPDGVAVAIDAGARGLVTIRLEGEGDISGIALVLVPQDGEEVVLSSGARVTTWDTTSVADGYYVIEARAADGTLVSTRVLVRNPTTTPLEIVAAAAGAVLLAAVVQFGLSAASGATSSASSASSSFDIFGFAQEVAIDAGEDKLRAKTRKRDRRRMQLRSLVAAAVSLAILAPLWAFSETDGWSVSEWLVLLPIVGSAAVIVIMLKYGAEAAMALATGARAQVRVWLAGAAALVLSAIVFRNPFGYPAYVDEIGESEAKHTWRMQGTRALATIAGAAAFMLPFLAVATLLPWSFVGIGLFIAATNLATTAMPFGPLPGRDVWRWNKWAAVAIAIAAFGVYFGVASALVPMWALWGASLAGGVAYGVTLLQFRKARAVAASIPVEVRVPVSTGPSAPGAEGGAQAPRPGRKGPKRGRD